MQTDVDIAGQNKRQIEEPKWRSDPTRSILQASRIFDLKDRNGHKTDEIQLGLENNDSFLVLIKYFQDYLENMQCQRNQIPQEWTQANNRLFINRQTYRASISVLCLGVISQWSCQCPVLCARGFFSGVRIIKSDWRSR